MARASGWPEPAEVLPGPVVDNHTHLDMVATWDAPGWWPGDPERRPTLTDHLERARAAGVAAIVQVGCDLDAIAWTDRFLRAAAPAAGDAQPTQPAHPAVPAAQPPAQPARPAAAAPLPTIMGAVAIHPNEAVLHAGVREIAPDGLEPDPHPRHAVALADAIAEVHRIARTNPRIRAIGETGLDFFRGGEQGRVIQRQAFRDHIAIAKELDLPLQIHDRDAHDDVVGILLADGAPERTVFHCFSGDAALARLAAEHGWYLSIAGPVTFKANESAREAVAAVPLELLMVETDAPFLTPHPLRGRPNSPYLVALTARTIAQVRGEPLERVCDVTTATATSLYGPW